MTLDFIQIYYEDSQLDKLYPFATPLCNIELNNYFENTVISSFIPLCFADYIGILSWRLKEKRQSGSCPIILKIYGNDDLSEEKILNTNADIINLRPFSPGHQMMANAAMWHGGAQHEYAWENAIKELNKFMSIPEEVKHPIYENAFVCRSDIYKSYVADCLNPVIDFVSSSDVFFSDSGYAQKKERTNPDDVKRYRELTGRNDWPIAPFILERLFSIWINDRNYKIVNA